MNQSASAPGDSSTKWWFLAFASVALFGNYYVYDAIGPLADTLNRELGFNDTQIGTLNAIYSLPNIFLVLAGGLLADRFGAGKVAFWTAVICFGGAALSASFGEFIPMATGRFFFGIGAETFIIALSVMIAMRFGGHVVALAMALNLSFGRLGSYTADVSPVWAGNIYDLGWQGPLLLAAAFAGVSALAAAACWWFDLYRPADNKLVAQAAEEHKQPFRWQDLVEFDRSFWYVAALNVLFYAVIFPFRSTFAIKYFQHAHDHTLESASVVNSYVYIAAIFLSPVFGWLADRFGRRGLMMTLGSLLLPLSFAGLMIEGWGAWVTTGLLGISFATVPAILWPAVVKLVKPSLLGTAYGLLFMLQAIGLFISNLLAGGLNDLFRASADNPAGYTPMLIFFGTLATAALVFAWLLWQRERGPNNHGLEEPR
jgi:MFS family permease